MLQYLMLVGAVINLSGAAFYIGNSLKGTTKPNRVTYLMWAVEPDVAIVFAILSDIFAGAPTLVKAWRYPDTETGLAYVLALASVLTTYFAIKVWTFPNYGFAVYLTVMDTLLVVAVFGSRFLHRRAKGRIAYAKIEE